MRHRLYVVIDIETAEDIEDWWLYGAADYFESQLHSPQDNVWVKDLTVYSALAPLVADLEGRQDMFADEPTNRSPDR